VCCSVLQIVTLGVTHSFLVPLFVTCIVLQRDAACFSDLQYLLVCCAVCCCVAVCCNVLQCVAVYCSVLQCVTV